MVPPITHNTGGLFIGQVKWRVSWPDSVKGRVIISIWVHSGDRNHTILYKIFPCSVEYLHIGQPIFPLSASKCWQQAELFRQEIEGASLRRPVDGLKGKPYGSEDDSKKESVRNTERSAYMSLEIKCVQHMLKSLWLRLFVALRLYVERELRIISYLWKHICPKKTRKKKILGGQETMQKRKIFLIIVNILKE